MLMEEFERLTGFYPTIDLYQEIERAYADSSEDKRVFCDKYRRNEDGMAEAIAQKCNLRTNKEAWLQRDESMNVEQQLQEKVITLNYNIARLKEQLEREQEWQSWTDRDAVSQEDYEKLINSSGSYELNDAEAKSLIHREFGFDVTLIEILRTADRCEINRHLQLRKIGETARAPRFDASDWYYVRFSVCGQQYEAWSGELKRV